MLNIFVVERDTEEKIPLRYKVENIPQIKFPNLSGKSILPS